MNCDVRVAVHVVGIIKLSIVCHGVVWLCGFWADERQTKATITRCDLSP